MFLFIPPAINIDNTVTQIKQEVYCDCNVFSTCLDNAYRVIPDDIKILNWANSNLFSTNLRLENIEDDINATWEEIDNNEFDLISNVKFSNIIKVKGRIKTVSKYKPTIVID